MYSIQALLFCRTEYPWFSLGTPQPIPIRLHEILKVTLKAYDHHIEGVPFYANACNIEQELKTILVIFLWKLH